MQASLITDKSSIRYLSNFTGSSGFMLITEKKSYLFTDFRYIERAKNTIKKGIKIIDTTRMWRNQKALEENWHQVLKDHRINIMGIEENNLTLSRFKAFKKISRIKGRKTIKFKNISGKIEALREVKSKKEIELITKSQRINEKVLGLIKKIIHSAQKTGKRVRESELAWKIKDLGQQFGAEDVSFDPIIAFGKHSAIPHHSPDKTLLKKNDIVLIDMGMKYQGYCSDMTRMVLPKKPTKLELEIYNLVLKAQKNAIKHIKAGISGAKADALSRDMIKEAGYGEQYGHAGGHGIGFDIHETPSLSENYKKKLKANSIITVEPGIYLAGKFGVRIEDMILVQKNGAKNLTRAKK